MPTREDAEDVASEAMLRAATYEALDPERLGQFLTTVTVRLCADVYRSSERGTRLVRRLGLDDVRSPEELACEASDRATVRELVRRLPASQRDVLVDRADGMSVTQISQRHALSYKAVESALSRARATMRAALAAATALALGAAASLRRRPELEVAVPAASIVLASALVAPLLPGGGPAGEPLALSARPATPIARSDDRPAGLVVPVAAVAPAPVAVRAVPAAEPKPQPTPSPTPLEVSVGDGDDKVRLYEDEDGSIVTREQLRKCVEEGPRVEAYPDGRTTLGPVESYTVHAGCGD